jgi:hypothetical protein
MEFDAPHKSFSPIINGGTENRLGSDKKQRDSMEFDAAHESLSPIINGGTENRSAAAPPQQHENNSPITTSNKTPTKVTPLVAASFDQTNVMQAVNSGP